jgi:hypothetical protein
MVSKQSTVGVLDVGAGTAWPIDDGAEAPVVATTNLRPVPTIKGTAAATGRFLLHFLEMGIAMGAGIGIFVPAKAALVAQGYSALLDTHSIEY